MSQKKRQFPHFFLPKNGESEPYTSPQKGGGSSPLFRNRNAHAKSLELSITSALQAAKQQINNRNPAIADDKPGFYLEFELQADKSDVAKKIESRQQRIELVTVKDIPDKKGAVLATVFVPESSADFYLKKVEKYRDEKTKKGKPKNEPLVSRIEAVQLGKIRSLFTDDVSLFPSEEREVWWEVWLRPEQHDNFIRISRALEIQIQQHTITFPEREIVLAMANVGSIAQIVENCGAIAELRIAKDTPSFFLDMGPCEQAEWTEDLATRLVEPKPNAVSVCILDSGITRTHRLLSPGLSADDMHTVEPNWGISDSSEWRGHGTAMAGVALYRDLLDVLSNQSGKVQLLHRLESVKILPHVGQNKPELYGAITAQGIALPEIKAPERHRVFCMAVTSSTETTYTGTPSSWSAAVDQLCFNDGDFCRLLIISAGNITSDIFARDYLTVNDIEMVENPAQAWNPLIVGAYTEKLNISEPDYIGWMPIAVGGDLSPRSRTSVEWETQWPIRPDVVFEGGNMAHDGQNEGIPINDLSLLTTHYEPQNRMFSHMCDTSCAAALASYMAAQIMTAHPNYRPETVRALIVHSAEWTSAMESHFKGISSKTRKRALVRRYGYGVPSLERALRSADNDLTIIVEDTLQPFCLKGTVVVTKDMNFHKLPWPSNVLEELGETDVELKVTLSYFIDPNPGERGWAYRHRYSSHGLRFRVKDSLESDKDFRWRVNNAVRQESEDRKIDSPKTENWFLGSNTRDCGSLHCDIWKGTAAELAQKDSVVIYPVGGWWKEKKYLNEYENKVKYSLILSIRAPEEDVDIYTPVANLIRTPVAT